MAEAGAALVRPADYASASHTCRHFGFEHWQSAYMSMSGPDGPRNVRRQEFTSAHLGQLRGHMFSGVALPPRPVGRSACTSAPPCS